MKTIEELYNHIGKVKEDEIRLEKICHAKNLKQIEKEAIKMHQHWVDSQPLPFLENVTKTVTDLEVSKLEFSWVNKRIIITGLVYDTTQNLRNPFASNYKKVYWDLRGEELNGNDKYNLQLQ
jgi:hypothetical protein